MGEISDINGVEEGEEQEVAEKENFRLSEAFLKYQSLCRGEVRNLVSKNLNKNIEILISYITFLFEQLLWAPRKLLKFNGFITLLGVIFSEIFML